jgi:hypothetical protein
VDEPLEIDVTWQHDGGVYALAPLSEEAIREAFPEAVLPRMIMIGHERDWDIDRLHRPHWQQLTLMLTGLRPEQIAQLGGVRLYDQDAEKTLWEWQPAPANGQ